MVAQVASQGLHNLLRILHTPLWMTGLLLVVSSILLPAKPVFASENYILGVVPQFTVRHTQRIWQPILERIESQTGIRLTLKGSVDIPTFEKEFGRGEFDFAYMNPYHVVSKHNTSGYLPLVRDTGRGLQGIIVVPKDSPIKHVKELDGKIVAFPAPNALGASLLIRSDFIRKLNIKVKPYYAQTHSAVYLDVALGNMDAGGGVQKTLDRQSKTIRNNLRVIYQTDKIAPHPLTAHPRVAQSVRNKIRDAFLILGENEEDRLLLTKIPMKKIGTAEISDYLSLRNMGLEKLIAE